MSRFNRRRLLTNIASLTKEKGIKIGDLEAEAGVSAGYFSRLNKGDSSAVPNIEVLTAVSDRLTITLDSLVKVDYETLTSSERYLIDFIDKLIAKASTFSMIWEEQTIRKMLETGINQDGDAIHPLLEVRELYEGIDPDTGYPSYDEKLVYNSLFYEGESIGLLGSSYHIDFDNSSVLWLVEVGVEDEDGAPDAEIEFYMQVNRRVTPICHTVHNSSSPFNEILFSLYQAAAETSKRPKIAPEVKSAIDSFMEESPY